MQILLRIGFFAVLPALLPAADTGFAKWWPQFQTAVAQRDVKAVARGVQFPLNWEHGPIRTIKAEADLTKSFDGYLTPESRKISAGKKPERMPNGVYSITWKARGNEYSVYFK